MDIVDLIPLATALCIWADSKGPRKITCHMLRKVLEAELGETWIPVSKVPDDSEALSIAHQMVEGLSDPRADFVAHVVGEHFSPEEWRDLLFAARVKLPEQTSCPLCTGKRSTWKLAGREISDSEAAERLGQLYNVTPCSDCGV